MLFDAMDNGWIKLGQMGIGEIRVIDLSSDRTWQFNKENYRDFQGIIYAVQSAGKKICGFGSIDFDDRLCVANSIAIATDFDLLHEIRANYDSPCEDLEKLAYLNRINFQQIPKVQIIKQLISLFVDGKVLV